MTSDKVYVAIESCGCIRGFYVVDCRDHKDQAKYLAKWAKARCSIEQWPIGDARKAKLYCEAHKAEKRYLQEVLP